MLSSIIKTTLILPFLFISIAAQPYTSSFINGDILEEGQYNLGFESQFITETVGSGIQFIARWDSPFSKDKNLRVIVGLGEIDFHAGAYLKWVPFPDLKTQPAVGLVMGLHYAKLGSLNQFSARFHPFVSKNLDLEMGRFMPYISLPLGIVSTDGNIDVSLQFEVGTEISVHAIKKIKFVAEIGVGLEDAFDYVSLGANYSF